MIDLVPIILVLFLFAALLRVDFFFSVVYLLAGVYIIGRIWARYSIRQLTTQRRLTNRAFPDEEIPVELIVRNRGFLPIPWLEIHDSLPVDMISPPFYREALVLSPHQERRFTYNLVGKKRGYYTIGPLIWRTGDLLGFTPQVSAQHDVEYIIVYPRVLRLEQLGLPTRSPLAQLPAPAPLFEDPSRVVGIKDYQVGDSPRRIHWSASAHASRLLVKRYQPAIARDTLICLDLNHENYNIKHLYEATELSIVVTSSIANHIIVNERLSVGLVSQAMDPLVNTTQAIRLAPRRERAHLMSILEILARAQAFNSVAPGADAMASFPDLLRQASMDLNWGATVVIVTGRETEGLFGTIVYLQRQGYAVALIVVMPAPPPPEVANQAAMLRLPIYEVWRQQDIEVLQ